MKAVNELNTPATILTGFLGSGKTTFLNAYLDYYSKKRFAIIENEFGAQSIDSDLIIRSEIDKVELNNGCLCCTLSDDLYDILNELYLVRNRFQELIIEATGVADPRGLAVPFMTNKSVKKQFPLKQIICLVDALLIEEQLGFSEEAIHQISYSDIILINKTDLVSASKIQEIKRVLQNINPIANIIATDQNKMASAIQQIEKLQTNQKLQNLDLEQFRIENLDATHQHTKGIKSIFLSFDQPFDFQKLHLRLMSFLMFQSKGLYRMKGIVSINNTIEKYKLQSVGTQLALDQFGQWPSNDSRISKFIFIGQGLQKNGLDKMLRQGLA